MEAMAPETRIVEVNKTFTVGKITFHPGDSFDTSSLSDHKVSQLLNQRFLRPVPTRPTQSKPEPG